jgi:hypothetical protein
MTSGAVTLMPSVELAKSVASAGGGASRMCRILRNNKVSTRTAKLPKSSPAVTAGGGSNKMCRVFRNDKVSAAKIIPAYFILYF